MTGNGDASVLTQPSLEGNLDVRWDQSRAADHIDGTGEPKVAIKRPIRGRLTALLVELRPRQWVKNALVIAAPAAAGALGHHDVPIRVGLACVAFCLLASGTYAINDVRDAPEDRLHPRKRFRPIAAGELSEPAGLLLGTVLMLGGIGICIALRPLLAVVGGGYVALTLSYTVFWRRFAVLDIGAIAGGFVLRAVAGGVAAPVGLSRWFLLVITCAAVFVASGKRWSELKRCGAGSQPRRAVLKTYRVEHLRIMLIGSVSGALLGYCVWALVVPAPQGVPWRAWTIAPFAASLLRYGVLLLSGAGEAPEDVLLRDRPLQLAGLTWVILFTLGLHLTG